MPMAGMATLIRKGYAPTTSLRILDADMRNAPRRINEDDNVLVYSTDPLPARCAGCRRLVAECLCKSGSVVGGVNPTYRIEKKGRGGKAVTVIARLPMQQSFLDELCTFLKKSAGAGGTSYTENGEGIVEIQGERLEQIKKLVATFCNRNKK